MRYNKLPTLISSVLIVMSVSAYGQEESSSLDELEQFINLIAQEIVYAGEDRAALRTEFDRELNNLKEKNQQFKVTVDNLVTALQIQIDDQQHQITALEIENQRLANIVEAQRQEKELLQQKVAQLDNEITKLKRQILRYFDNGDGTVTDLRSGLIWLKDANCFGKLDLGMAKYYAKTLISGECGLSDGSTAGMWRLPTRDEWESMVDNRYQNPALSNASGTGQWKEGEVFSGVQSSHYWSSTFLAWYVSLGSGNADDDQTSSYYVWPVRGGQ